MIEVKTRSEESWGPLASLKDSEFNKLINCRNKVTKTLLKDTIKNKKKLKKYKVSFLKEWHSDQYEIMAEDDYDVSAKAREFFKENADKIGFKEKERSRWDQYPGYDSLSYVKVRT